MEVKWRGNWHRWKTRPSPLSRMADLQAQEARRRRRYFIRAHHPDRGGDPEAFIAGLCAFGAGHEPDTGPPPPEVIVIRQRAWLLLQAATVARRLRYGPKPPRVR